jgi:hypothetical protein
MGDLLLRTRLDVTLTNLERVENLPDLLSRRDERIDRFLGFPEDLKTSIKQLQKRVLALKSVVLEVTDAPDELQQYLDDLEDELQQVVTQVRGMSKEAQDVREEFERLTENRRDLDIYLTRAAGEAKVTVTADNYWKERERCERIFHEYVDYLRGVALRGIGLHDDTGRVNDLFRLADALPQLWGRFAEWSWQSLAVPSRIEQNTSTQASVLRIGFPEWTVWALPLLQHEFGHVVIDKHQSALPVADATEAAILADALAALVTGPAYACAELLLRLDPKRVDASSDETLRSATILATLDCAAEATGDPSLSQLAQRLNEEWRDAILSVGGEPAVVDRAKSSLSVQGTLRTASEFLRLGWTGGPACPPEWASRWPRVVEWSKLLIAGQADQIHAETLSVRNGDRPMPLAFLLNAAWEARVSPAPGESHDRKTLDAIATATVRHMLDLLDSDEPPSTKKKQSSRT